MSADDSKYVENLKRSGLSIYDSLGGNNQKLWIPTEALERILDRALKGYSVAGMPLRTRSKAIKTEVCKILGYDVPHSFQRTRPRFPGQNFDTYIQKSDNLQVWNEELSASRRYVLIRVGDDDRVARVKVVSGDALAFLDTTGTLTQKYQARVVPSAEAELVSAQDTDHVQPLLAARSKSWMIDVDPTDEPIPERVFPIAQVFERLRALLGASFGNIGSDQERNRGAQLHHLVCQGLGYTKYRDDGRFPDVRNQLLEVKLQTSPTIDLGLVRPDSQEHLDMVPLNGIRIRHCDVRYAVFYGILHSQRVVLKNLILTTGMDFFSRFQQFQGRVLNKKLQIPLPRDFFLL